MSRSRLRTSIRACALLATISTMAIATDGCRDATQVTFVLSTTPKITCAGLRGVQLTVAGSDDAAEERASGDFVTAMAMCADPASHDIGTLVVTPGSSGKMAMVVVVGIRNEARTCKRSNHYDGCVVARRSLSFRDHVSATVPIAIDPNCVDVPCDTASTCQNGACITSHVDCDDDGSCISPDPRGRDEDSGVEAADARGDGPGADGADDASMKDGSTGDAADSGPPVACKANCPQNGAGLCAMGTACCHALDSAGTMITQTCTTYDDCNGGTPGRQKYGVYECCRNSADCMGASCCQSADHTQTICRASCNGDEKQLCASPADCSGGPCGMAVSPLWAPLMACQ